MLEKRTLALETVGKVGETVTVFGWVHARRNMGKLVFFDLRDASARLQIVGVPQELLDDESRTALDSLRGEFVVEVTGIVQARGAKQINPEQATGTVELLAKSVKVLNESKTPPFEIDNEERQANEELRLKYRYLDLRHERLVRNIKLRDRVVTFFRDYMHAHGFTEIETPILMKGTPEGSREYIVPSRLHAGKFFVLPQSPQQFKQLLMVAGFEKYFQIARCFRDEDQRGDRQPEFTQFDFEMSFVEAEDIYQYTEAMMIELIKTVTPEKKITQIPFPRMTYAEAMEKYGNDKPDIRVDKNDPNELGFAWVLDFPMFETDDEGNLAAKHHPFCAVHPDDLALLETDPLKVRANAYDLVMNGFELSSGSIRIHNRAEQQRIFDILKITPAQQELKFGHMLEAFEYGAPPHGGFAPGIDRIVMLLAGEPNIREVIAFPKTGDARDPMMGAPSEVDQKTLDEAHIQLKK
ncbi:MAG: aspartate--tRNA ligase [Candidatus Magasanikbacteria bacterium]|nr:aspartate--tRNA ligase [Candidatus Magasanikbacteria bacterium]